MATKARFWLARFWGARFFAATGPLLFQPWTVGTADFRFLKSRIVVTTADGLPVIIAFKTILDVEERTEKKEGVTVAAGGTSITFAQRFHKVPNLQVTAQGAVARFPMHDNETVSGFDVKVFDSGGADVGGTVDWIAVGV